MIVLKSYLRAEEKWNSKNVIGSSSNLNSIYEYKYRSYELEIIKKTGYKA